MSIKKIAQNVGVSAATVSRVLNNPQYRCLDPNIREKIWQEAIKQNYTPNEAARNLRLGGKKNEEKIYYIGVLITRTENEASDPFFTEVLKVVESEIHKQWAVLSQVWYNSLFSNDKKCKRENLDLIIDKMISDNQNLCDGLIVIGKCNKDAIKKLKAKFKNVVSINRNSTNYEVDEVICDGMKVAQMAIEHLISLEHKSIGYVGDCSNEARYRGYIETLKKHDIEPDTAYIISCRQNEKSGYEAMEKFFLSDDRPTGIYCANDIIAIGMLKYLLKCKNKFYTPSIISSDDIEEASYTNPMLTTVSLPKTEMGKFAVSLLIDKMKGGHKSTVKLELEGKLVIRNSCKNADEAEWCEYYI